MNERSRVAIGPTITETRKRSRRVGRGHPVALVSFVERAGVGGAVGIAALAAVCTSWWIPSGPTTTAHALGTMAIGTSVGAVSGVALRSRWAMLIAPIAFIAVFEFARLRIGGATVDDINPISPGGMLALIVGRGFHGLVEIVPMVLGAAFGAALVRRVNDAPSARSGRARIELYARRTIAGAVSVAMVALAAAIARPASIASIRDEKGQLMAGSLSEKIRVEINGVKQGMFIKSTNAENPVLLFVHGGPGMPMYWLTQRYPTGLEDHFTVVWWEQRGAGLSYQSSIAPETMTAEQFVGDTLEVTRYLLKRFNQDKVYLMGHSWGSYIGIQAAAKAPELYHAYVGVGQVTDQLESEQLAYDYALAHYNEVGDRRMVRKLEAAPPGTTAPLPANYNALRDEYMHKAGIGTTRDMKSVITGLFLPSFRSHEYTLIEKVNLWRGKIRSRMPEFGLWDTLMNTDLRQTVTDLSIPAYFFHGKYDYTCAYPLAKEYLVKLKAPVKGFYTFETSAHSPMFEEPERTVAIMIKDVLTGTKSLADD
jgi:pimeloyl-ACP methyl ester carboxylesterase